MVKYAFDDDEDDQMDAESLYKEAEENDDSLGPDDTFEMVQTRRQSGSQMPGSFDSFVQHEEAAHGAVDRSQSQQKEATPEDEAYESVVEDADMTMRSESVSQESAMEQDDYEDQLVEIQDESDSGIESIPEAKTWIEQLQQTSMRYRVLGTVRPPRKARARKTTYTVHDLDRDLFAKRPRFKPVSDVSSSLLSGMGAEAANYPPKFMMRWGRNTTSLTQSSKDSRINIQGIEVGRENEQTNCLKVQLKHTQIELKDGTPYAKTKVSFIAEEMIASLPHSDRSVWTLTSALFDPLTVPDVSLPTQQAIRDRVRKSKVSKWLEESVKEAVKNDEARANTSAEKTLARLTGHQIEDACALATGNGDMRLAILLTLAGGDENVREDLRNQVDDWRTKGSLPFIDMPYRIMYEIMSGNVSVSRGTGKFEDGAASKPYHIAQNLDWKRAFGLRLWYETFPQETIEDAVARYDDALRQKVSVSSPGQDVQDLHYHLLKLYANSSNAAILDPRTMGLHSLDWRNSWQLMIFLARAQNKLQLDAIQADQLSLHYITELDAKAEWEWALFVTLHIQDPTVREAAAKSLLSRYAERLTDELQSFLENELTIPSLWILEAKALLCRDRGDHEQEMECLLAAKLYSEAHHTLITHVAPQAIISGQHEPLIRLLAKFSGKEKGIDSWSSGGQLYRDVHSLLNQQVNEKLLSRLETAVNIMPTPTFQQRVTKTEIQSLLTGAQLAAGTLSNITSSNELNFEKSVKMSLMYFNNLIKQS